jgi:hypothetical protein
MPDIVSIHTAVVASSNIQEALLSMEIINPSNLALFLLKISGGDMNLWDESSRDSTVSIIKYDVRSLVRSLFRSSERFLSYLGFFRYRLSLPPYPFRCVLWLTLI